MPSGFGQHLHQQKLTHIDPGQLRSATDASNRRMGTDRNPRPALGGKKIALRGGDGTEAHLPNPPLPSLVAVPGGGFGLGLPYLPCRGGGGGVRPQHTWLKMIPTSR